MKRLLMVCSFGLIVLSSACSSPGAEPAEPDSGGEDSFVVTGSCDNPFLAISPDQTWRYSAESTGVPAVEFTLTYDRVTEDSFTAHKTFTEFTSEVQWNCSAEGLIATEFANVNLLNTDSGAVEFEVLEFSGTTLPPAEDWVLGYSWESHFQMRGAVEVEGNLVDTEINLTVHNTIAAIEPVEVPAGSFLDAYRIDSSGSIVLTLNLGGSEIPGIESAIDYATWYVRDIGMIKTTSSYEGIDSITQLLALE